MSRRRRGSKRKRKPRVQRGPDAQAKSSSNGAGRSVGGPDSQPGDDSQRRPISRRRRNIYRLLCLCLPFLLLAIAEGGLRLAGFGGYAPFFREIEADDGTTLVITDTAGSASYFFANRDKPGTNNEFAFKMPKPAGTTRIMLCGASAIKGFPQPVAFSAGAFLQEILQDVWPDREVEVINLGTTAVASFPVLDIMRQAMAYDPDLVILYTGNNEFFGAYGVASANRGMASPRGIAWQYRLRSLAVVQGLQHMLNDPQAMEDRTLMEFMVGELVIPPDSPLRDGAARLLHSHVSQMADLCAEANVPLLVCKPAANEKDLAPLGEVKLDGLPSDDRRTVTRHLQVAQELAKDSPAEASKHLREVLRLMPIHAGAHYLLARCEERLGDEAEAVAHYQYAVDLDTMPWRPPSKSIEAIVRAAEEKQAPICDVPTAFREASSGSPIGKKLMDDHVHFSLEGQALLARTLAASLKSFPQPLHVSPEALAKLPDWETYAERLGRNPYDAYGVAVQMSSIFGIPFMRKTNPDVSAHWSTTRKRMEDDMTPAIRVVAEKWQNRQTHGGGMRPMSGMVARALLRERKVQQAYDLYQVAQRCVPEYSSWHMEYVYFALACRQQLNGSLSAEETTLAAEELRRGRLLLSAEKSKSGMAERYMGRLHQLRGEFAEAIPYLKAARSRMSGMDLVATDQALVMSYLQTGRRDSALSLVDEGIRLRSEYKRYYEAMRRAIPRS